VQGKNNSWAIRWYASAFLKDKLTLYPGRSLVLNIGNDASGTHCDATDIFDTYISEKKITIAKIPIIEDDGARKAVSRYLRYSRRRLVIEKIGRLWRQS
jgi:hypothetical protein